MSSKIVVKSSRETKTKPHHRAAELRQSNTRTIRKQDTLISLGHPKDSNTSDMVCNINQLKRLATSCLK